MKKIAILGMAASLLAVAPAEAAGCLKGAAVGGVAGHYVGHGHAVIGAMAGCAYGHHRAAVAAKQKKLAAQQAAQAHR